MRRLPSSWSDSLLARLGFRRRKARRALQPRRLVVESPETRTLLSGTPLEDATAVTALVTPTTEVVGVELVRPTYVIVSQEQADHEPSDQFVVRTEYGANGTPQAVVSLRDGLAEIDDTLHTLQIELQLGGSVIAREEVLIDIESSAFRQQFLQDRLDHVSAAVATLATPEVETWIDSLSDVSNVPAGTPDVEEVVPIGADQLSAIAKSARENPGVLGDVETRLNLYSTLVSSSQEISAAKLTASTEEAVATAEADGEEIGRAGLLLVDRLKEDLTSDNAELKAVAETFRDELVSTGGIYYTLFTGLGVNQEVKRETLADGRVQVFKFLENGAYQLSDHLRIELGSQQAMVQATAGPGFGLPLSDYSIGPSVDTYVDSQHPSQSYGTSGKLQVSHYSTALFSWNLTNEQGKLPTSATLNRLLFR